MNMTKIAVIVPVFNRRELALNFLRQMGGILAEGVQTEFVFVDDGSTDGTSEAILEHFPEVTILRGDGNLWWTGAVRMGAEFALKQGYDYVLIMNDDLELDKEFLSELFKVATRYPGALVSSIKLMKNADGREQIMNAGFKAKGILKDLEVNLEGERYDATLPEAIECDLLTGSSLLIPANVFRDIGQFDNKNFPQGFGDFEFTWRASKAGYKCIVACKSKVYTELNPNYANQLILKATRMEYFKSLFNYPKYGHGFRGFWKVCHMHRNIIIGTILYFRRMIGLTKNIILKLLFPNGILRKIIRDQSIIRS